MNETELRALVERMVAESLRECAADCGRPECTIPHDGTCAPAAAKGWVIQ